MKDVYGLEMMKKCGPLRHAWMANSQFATRVAGGDDGDEDDEDDEDDDRQDCTMTDPTILSREEPKGLGLGWLLVIALGGGALLFLAIGLLLAWRIRHHRKPCRTTVYTRSVDDLRGLSRLTKRRFAESTKAMPTTASMTTPPVLPPLPTYNSFNLFKSSASERKLRLSQLFAADDDDDDARVPQPRKGLRERRPSKGSWFSRSRTLSSLGAAEKGESAGWTRPPRAPGHGQQPQPQPTTKTTVAGDAASKRRQAHVRARSEPPAARPDEAPDRPRALLAHDNSWQAAATDTDLRDILRSTDARLRKRSRGPSPTKTLRSCRTGSSRAGRSTPSPTKRGGGGGASIPTTTKTTSDGLDVLGHDASAASVRAAADGFSTEAAQGPELPGISSTASGSDAKEREARGDDEWQSQLSPMRSPQRSPERPQSRASEASSSLSTLYSVGDPEEGRDPPPPQQPRRLPGAETVPAAAWRAGWQNPFVGGGGPRPAKGWPAAKPQPCGPRPLRRIKTASPRSLAKGSQAATPGGGGAHPLRPISANSLHALFRDGGRAATSARRWPSLPPPPALGTDRGRAPLTTDGGAAARLEAGEATGRLPSDGTGEASESSFTTDSVNSAESGSESESDGTRVPTCETPRHEWLARDGRSPTGSPPTPPRRSSAAMAAALSAASSSPPYNEHDILSMLLSTAPPRALPRRRDGSGGEQRPAAWGRPRPRGASGTAAAAELRRIDSLMSSHSAASVSSAPLALNNTIAELRRMNSMVSSYSTASVASTAVGRDGADSPTLPGPWSGGGGGAIGSRHYLNIGTGPTRRPRHHSKPAADRDRLLPISPQARDGGDGTERGKENRAVAVAKAPRRPDAAPPVPGLKDPRRRSAARPREPCTAPAPAPAPAAGPPAAPAGPPWPRLTGAPPVKHLAVAYERRIADGHARLDRDASPASLSPDADPRTRCLRM